MGSLKGIPSSRPLRSRVRRARIRDEEFKPSGKAFLTTMTDKPTPIVEQSARAMEKRVVPPAADPDDGPF